MSDMTSSKMKLCSDPSIRGLSGAVPNSKQECPSGQGNIAAPSLQRPANAPLGLGGWIVVVVLLGVLFASILFAVWGWNLTDATISTGGMISLALGVVVTLAVGGGLMALVFWSSRNGYDG
jgi:hypothetical protein